MVEWSDPPSEAVGSRARPSPSDRVFAQPGCPVTFTELRHDLALDLSHALSRQAETPADLIESTGHAVVEPVTQVLAEHERTRAGIERALGRTR